MSTASAKLRTIVVDDEPLARRLLRELLQDIPEVELIAECKNGREAVAAARDLTPDLLLLDIQMPEYSGFDVIKELQSDLMPMVIFCTAFHRYAVDAFDLHAVDYLLKPIDSDRLKRGVARAVQRLHDNQDDNDRKMPLVGAIESISQKIDEKKPAASRTMAAQVAPTDDRKIAIKDQDSTTLVEVDDIDWIDAAGDYMCVHVKGETLIMRSTLKNLMERLDQNRFKRIHRSTVVNLERIVKATSLNKGEFLLDLDCDHKLKVSRNYRQAIKTFLQER